MLEILIGSLKLGILILVCKWGLQMRFPNLMHLNSPVYSDFLNMIHVVSIGAIVSAVYFTCSTRGLISSGSAALLGWRLQSNFRIPDFVLTIIVWHDGMWWEKKSLAWMDNGIGSSLVNTGWNCLFRIFALSVECSLTFLPQRRDTSSVGCAVFQVSIDFFIRSWFAIFWAWI